MPSNTDTAGYNTNDMAAIVLAGGLSKRMGRANKLLLPLADRTFLQNAVYAVWDAGVGEVIVVLGHDCEKTQLQLVDLPERSGQSVRWVVNADYAQGQATSVHCGLKALRENKIGVLICLADQPLISTVHIHELTASFASREVGKQAVVPFYNGQRGNPVVVSKDVRRRVLEDKSQVGCRSFIDSNPDLVTKMLAADVAYITDIDTRDEYRALKKSRSNLSD